MSFSADQWAVILGGSSGFGLATAKRLGALGMSVCAVHRDRRAMLAKIEPEFEKIRAGGTRLLTINTDALDAEKRREVIDELAGAMGNGRVRVLLHSVAFGNLKLLVAEAKTARRKTADELAGKLGVDAGEVQKAIDELFTAGHCQALGLASAPEYSDKHFLDEEDFSRTIHAMGTSLLGWVQELFSRGLFAKDARVFGLTSEGNEVAWRGYAAVAAAKVSLESLARSIAVEFAPYGIRCNVIQAGITHTPAQDAIPGSAHMRAQALARNPMGRLTTPEDVASVIGLLASDEAGWINGEVIRVDGGEHISGTSS
ncbi:MAG TPA: SDR family oxidoreductase [Myxococcota bacterium]|nr:SDR family oxidoreductase [Myxococcota bacterium]